EENHIPRPFRFPLLKGSPRCSQRGMIEATAQVLPKLCQPNRAGPHCSMVTGRLASNYLIFFTVTAYTNKFWSYSFSLYASLVNSIASFRSPAFALAFSV